MEPLTYGSLFSGIGGLDLGLDHAGMICKWQVEIDGYASKVLAKHWPDVTRYGDIRTVGKHNLESVNVICGGFPCQDISIAGKKAGIEGSRSGLWKEYHRVICELRPQYIIVENVAALLERGISRVLGDLASIGYDAEWQVLPAEAFGAPHKRERIFIVAYTCSQRYNYVQLFPRNYAIYRNPQWNTAQNIKSWQGWQRWFRTVFHVHDWIETSSAILGMVNGLSTEMDRIRTIGNSVVPQIAQFIGECIVEHAKMKGE